MIELPDYITYCINKLNSKGFECFVVGGAIRDALLNRNVNDYDITTNSTPLEIKEVFKNDKTIDTGIKHGTVTVLVKSHPIEITTYRIDGTYNDSRHPDNVIFTQSIYEDCKRRDFTINAICYHPTIGILDFFNGTDDINNKIIRCINDPDTRFNEDALRIIRALRFSCQLDFKIEENTKKSIIKNKDLLKNISIERISEELLKILNPNNSSHLINEYFEVFKVFIPQLDKLSDKERINTINYLSNISTYSNSKLASLLFYLKEDAIDIMNNLKLPNITKKKITFLLNNYNLDLNNKINIKKILSNNEEYFLELVEFIKIIKPNTNTTNINKIKQSIIKNNEPYKLNQLKINGNDITYLGYKGPIVSTILEDVLLQVIKENIQNDKNLIIKYITEKYDVI